jgi:hypothetical protein
MVSHPLPLLQGDCVIFNNRRVLHGRTDFDASERRLLNGCYVDRCDFLSRLAGVVTQPMPYLLFIVWFLNKDALTTLDWLCI